MRESRHITIILQHQNDTIFFFPIFCNDFFYIVSFICIELCKKCNTIFKCTFTKKTWKTIFKKFKKNLHNWDQIHICFLVCITHYYISISKKVFPHASYFLDTIFCYLFVKKEKIVQLRTTYVHINIVTYSCFVHIFQYWHVSHCHFSQQHNLCSKTVTRLFLQKAQKSWTAAHSCLKMEEISRSIKNERYFKD